MEKLEKVIQALKCCRVNEDDPCEGNCPYDGEEDCIGKVMVDAFELLSGLKYFLEFEIQQSTEWQNDKNSPMYDGVCVGSAEAYELRKKHIKFCQHLLSIEK